MTDYRSNADASILQGNNAAYVDLLYEQYLEDPESVSKTWQQYFQAVEENRVFEHGRLPEQENSENKSAMRSSLNLEADYSDDSSSRTSDKQSNVLHLINAHRMNGHLSADTNPILDQVIQPQLDTDKFGLSRTDLEEVFNTGRLVGPGRTTLKNILIQIRKTYCGSIGAEFMHLTSLEEREWVRTTMEKCQNQSEFNKEERTGIYSKLFEAESFEQFLATKFLGQKRFSLEGAEALIPMMQRVIDIAGTQNLQECVIGMAHRGRLNVLANIMGKPLDTLFSEFAGHYDEESMGTGDVKYHMGFSSDVMTKSGNMIHLSLAFNPSHLEFVNPVVEGSVRARIDRSRDPSKSPILPVLIHGDSAFTGQGVVAETLNLSQLEGYKTGGTIHIVINNQIGFTTTIDDYCSNQYSTDIAKIINVPVFHVNADDPEACLHCVWLAMAYRKLFNKDVVIDLVCYRKHGHNETDDPSFTQPLMYQKIKKHKSCFKQYRDRCIEKNLLAKKDLDKINRAYKKKLNDAFNVAKSNPVKSSPDTLHGYWSGIKVESDDIIVTGVEEATLKILTDKITNIPKEIKPHPKVAQLYERRKKMVFEDSGIDWGMGETLAFATLLNSGTSIRITGQDSCRGTFSHRHGKLHDFKSGASYVPLNHLSEEQSELMIYDSPLSEAAVLGFEYGYSLSAPRTLVLWEAQFGDFANGAQVIIDQFVTCSEEKWRRMTGLVMLLPHGYEGQGPEHSSARLERFLQMCGHNNIQVCYPTTPGQYFHLLRRQILREFRKPLVIMTPKSLLRNPRAVSKLIDFQKGTYLQLLQESFIKDYRSVKTLIFCSGKIYYEIREFLDQKGHNNVPIIRFEQLYPFPHEDFKNVMMNFPEATSLVWAQEEPKNMGAWQYARIYIQEKISEKQKLDYAGREPSGSTATGVLSAHKREQLEIMERIASLIEQNQ